jgi:dUTP pyrophosphatase
MSTQRIKVRITRVSTGGNPLPLPAYATPGSSGMDVVAAEGGTIRPGETKLVPTGFAIAVPGGYEAQVRPRSGLAIKHGVGILNTPGTIDSDYRGEVKIILTNFGSADFVFSRGDRIAQMVIAPVVTAEMEEVTRLDETERGAGGFGSTGTSVKPG